MLSTSRFGNRSIFAFGIAGLLAATATAGINAAGPWPSAVGGGTTSDSVKFAFSALKGPSSTRGTYGSSGHARLDFPDGTKKQGEVLCVFVDPGGYDAVFVFQYSTDPIS